MAKKRRSPFNLAGNQLSLFDLSQFEKARSHYDIEDGDEEDDDWPPQPVSESIDEFVSESIWPPDPPDDSLTTDPINDSLTSIDADSLTPCGAVNKYHAGGTARGGYEYWRFSYRVGNKVKQIHIPGGNTSSAIATGRAASVTVAIASGKSVAEVLELIRSFTKKHQ